MSISSPNIKNTLGHRFATDTAIAWRNRAPTQAQPPDNVPLFPGQLIAVPGTGRTCRLYVGSEDGSTWMEVTG